MPHQIVMRITTLSIALGSLFLLLMPLSALGDQRDEYLWQTIMQGRDALLRHQYRDALALFERATAINPSDPRPYFWQALVFDELGEPKEALKRYTSCIEKAKTGGYDCAEMRLNLGNTLIKLNYPKQAEYDFLRALQIDPRLTIAHLFLGRLYVESKQYQKALAQLDLLSAGDLQSPDFRAVPYLKALALKGLGRRREALDQLKYFMQIEAANPTAPPIQSTQSAQQTQSQVNPVTSRLRQQAEKLMQELTAEQNKIDGV